MNDMADHVAEYKASPEFIEYRQTRIAETLGAVVMRCDALDHRVTVAMLAAMAEELGAGTPDVLLMHEKAVSETSPLRKIVDPLCPIGSARREVLKSIGRAVQGKK